MWYEIGTIPGARARFFALRGALIMTVRGAGPVKAIAPRLRGYVDELDAYMYVNVEMLESLWVELTIDEVPEEWLLSFLEAIERLQDEDGIQRYFGRGEFA